MSFQGKSEICVWLCLCSPWEKIKSKASKDKATRRQQMGSFHSSKMFNQACQCSFMTDFPFVLFFFPQNCHFYFFHRNLYRHQCFWSCVNKSIFMKLSWNWEKSKKKKKKLFEKMFSLQAWRLRGNEMKWNEHVLMFRMWRDAHRGKPHQKSAFEPVGKLVTEGTVLVSFL